MQELVLLLPLPALSSNVNQGLVQGQGALRRVGVWVWEVQGKEWKANREGQEQAAGRQLVCWGVLEASDCKPVDTAAGDDMHHACELTRTVLLLAPLHTRKHPT